MEDEKRLVQRMVRGDRQAFESFLDSYGGRVHGLVKRYIDNPSDAEDVSQEIFLEIYKCIGNFRGDSALSTWVFRVAVNHCLKYRQRQAPPSLPVEEAVVADSDWRNDPGKSALKTDLADQVHAALHDLSPLHYDVVVLCELYGFSYQECASTLEIPIGTVKSRLFNAVKSLRGKLAAYVRDEPVSGDEGKK